jgi:hypothetical protein
VYVPCLRCYLSQLLLTKIGSTSGYVYYRRYWDLNEDHACVRSQAGGSSLRMTRNLQAYEHEFESTNSLEAWRRETWALLGGIAEVRGDHGRDGRIHHGGFWRTRTIPTMPAGKIELLDHASCSVVRPPSSAISPTVPLAFSMCPPSHLAAFPETHQSAILSHAPMHVPFSCVWSSCVVFCRLSHRITSEPYDWNMLAVQFLLHSSEAGATSCGSETGC